MKEKKKRIKNKFYVEFLEKGLITYINEEHIDKAVCNIKGKYRNMATCLLYLAYLTGARPIELLQLKAGDVIRDGNFVKVQFLQTAKNGLPRTIFLSWRNRYVKFIWEYANSLMPNVWLFWAFMGTYRRSRLNKRGVVREYVEVSRPLRWYFVEWFRGVFGVDGVVPYHLRHNRFSKLSERGVSMEDLRVLKGAKTLNSVMPYVHMSSDRAKRIAKSIN